MCNWIIATLKIKNVWLGGSDIEEEGSWRWVTGEAWEYANWGRSQPSDSQQNEDGLRLRPDGKWDDLRQNYRLHFLIEWEPR